MFASLTTETKQGVILISEAGMQVSPVLPNIRAAVLQVCRSWANSFSPSPPASSHASRHLLWNQEGTRNRLSPSWRITTSCRYKSRKGERDFKTAEEKWAMKENELKEVQEGVGTCKQRFTTLSNFWCHWTSAFYSLLTEPVTQLLLKKTLWLKYVVLQVLWCSFYGNRRVEVKPDFLFACVALDKLSVISKPCFFFFFFKEDRDVSGGPLVKTLCFDCREHRFNSW